MITKVRAVGIVSLSHGTIGEPAAQHEVQIGLRRLETYGLQIKFMDHALWGHAYLKQHPEARASHPNGGFELLQGPPQFHGKILGGCLESIYDVFFPFLYPDTVALCKKYEYSRLWMNGVERSFCWKQARSSRRRNYIAPC